MYECLDQWPYWATPWWLNASVSYRNYRDEPRFQALIEAMNARIDEAEKAGPIVPIPD